MLVLGEIRRLRFGRDAFARIVTEFSATRILVSYAAFYTKDLTFIKGRAMYAVATSSGLFFSEKHVYAPLFLYCRCIIHYFFWKCYCFFTAQINSKDNNT